MSEHEVEIKRFEVQHDEHGELSGLTVHTREDRGSGGRNDWHEYEIKFAVANDGEEIAVGVNQIKDTERSHRETKGETVHVHSFLPAVIAAEDAVAERLDPVDEVKHLADRLEKFAGDTELVSEDERRGV